MKKSVAGAIIFLAVVLSGCSVRESGCKSELTESSWRARLDGGAEASLSFNGDEAAFIIENAGEKAEIRGRYIADETSFVIFVPSVGQNYSFDYTPKGDTLELEWGGGRLELLSE